ncbi:MAG: hypothetical protein RR145_01285, partial [Oscillospiraceae bacterium]
HKSEKVIEEFIEQLKLNPGSCDEVWLASDYGFPPLEKHEESARLMKKATELLRNIGVRVSLQISNTLGHGEYIKKNDCSGLVYKDSPIGKMMGIDGATSDYCFCWNNEKFREYSFEFVKKYAKIMPDCVWVDDDLRVHNHGEISFGCFCDTCIAKFNDIYDTEFSRETLAEEFYYGDVKIRKQYIDFIRDGLSEYTKLLTNAVMEVSPKSQMGYQYDLATGYGGCDVDFIFDAMKTASDKIPKSRPGGGYYSDYNPNEMLEKMMLISHANAETPKYVSDICPEVENTPDVFFGKSIHGTCLESTMYLSYGCNSLSYATLMTPYEPLWWHGEMLGEFLKHKPYWNEIISKNKNSNNTGVCVYLPKNSYLKNMNKGDDVNEWAKVFWNEGKNFLRFGVPICHNLDGAVTYLITSHIVDSLTDDEIMALIDMPVLTDGNALEKLISRGYGKYFSVKAEVFNPVMYKEVFENHPVNQNSIGASWRQGGLNSDLKSHLLFDKNGDTERISTYFSCIEDDEYCMANAIVKTYGNKGGKWAVFGYGLWDTVLSFDKRNQIISAIDYICGNKLPAVILNRNQVCTIPHTNSEGEMVYVTLLNCCIGNSNIIELAIRNPIGENFFFMSGDVSKTPLTYVKHGENYILKIPAIAGWHAITVFSE